MNTGIRIMALRVAAVGLLIGSLSLDLGGSTPGHFMKLYVTNSQGDDITVIDLQTMKVVGSLNVGEHPHGLAAQPDGQRLYATIESEHALKVIDPATDQIIETIALTGKPNQCAVTPNGKFLVVPIRDANSIDIVDLLQKKVVKVLPIRVPHNCYNAGSNSSMFCTSMGNKTVDEIDLTTMSEKVKILVGGVPRPLAVTKDEKTLYVELSDLHGFVIADIPERRVVQTVHFPPVPLGVEPLEPHTPTHGLALSQHDRELWVAGVVDNGVYVYDIPTKKLSRKIPTGNAPIWLAISPDGRYCCVSNAGSDDCSIIDTQTRKEVARLKVGKMPKRLVVVEASR